MARHEIEFKSTDEAREAAESFLQSLSNPDYFISTPSPIAFAQALRPFEYLVVTLTQQQQNELNNYITNENPKNIQEMYKKLFNLMDNQ